MNDDEKKSIQREILLSFWKIHILLHASKKAVVGRWMIKELQGRGYDVSPGTLYPILHRMEKFGWLKSKIENDNNPKSRRLFSITDKGKGVLDYCLKQLSEIRNKIEGM